MFCKNCGNNCPDGVMFCTNCGAKLSVAQNQQTYQQPYQQAYQQPYQQPYQQNQPTGAYQPYAPQPFTQATNDFPGFGLGIASLVIGIIALIFICFPYITIPAAIASIVMGGISISKSRSAGRTNGMGIAGLVCSIIAILLCLYVIATTESFWTEFYDGFNGGLGGSYYYYDF